MRTLRVCITLLSLCCFNSTALAAVVQTLAAEGTDNYTRMVFDLDRRVEHRIFTLEAPDRLVIDLADSVMQASTSTVVLDNTAITRVRSAPRNEKDLRVVLDLNRKLKPRSFLQEGAGNRTQLVIELYEDEASIPLSSSTPANNADSKREIVVAINAGHGGHDPGAIGVNKLEEKRVTYAIAREVEQLVNSLPGYRAVMIREGDYFMELRDRVRKSHLEGADLYLAIHADAHENTKANGTTIYALSQRGATSEQARLLAEKENSADLIGVAGSVDLRDKDEVLASVLIDLSMNASVSTSLEIGDIMIGSLQQVVNMRRTNVEQAAFVELMSAGIPALLIETGYITNKGDAKNLDSSAWRRNFASALVNSINQWFYDRPPAGTWVAWQKANGGLIPASYTVARGDTLSEIAERFNTNMAVLKQINDLSSGNIRVGQKLKLPGSSQFGLPLFREHTISRGETLSQIAMEYSVSLDTLRNTNDIKGDRIRVGQVLKIPTT